MLGENHPTDGFDWTIILVSAIGGVIMFICSSWVLFVVQRTTRLLKYMMFVILCFATSVCFVVQSIWAILSLKYEIITVIAIAYIFSLV